MRVWFQTPAHPIATGPDQGDQCLGDAFIDTAHAAGDMTAERAVCQACHARFTLTLTVLPEHVAAPDQHLEAELEDDRGVD